MSTNSINQFSVADDGRVTNSPPQSTKKCTRTTPCSQQDCNSCTEPVNDSHVRDLANDLEDSQIKPTIPPNHWITKLTKALKETIQDQDPVELKMLINRYERKIDALSDDDFDYDRTEIKQLHRDAMQILASIPTIPIQLPSPPPPLQTVKQHQDGQNDSTQLVR